MKTFKRAEDWWEFSMVERSEWTHEWALKLE